MLAWSTEGPDNSDRAVEALTMRPDGSPRGATRVVNRGWAGEQALPFVAPVGPSRFWVGWQTRPGKDELAEVRFRIL